MTFLLASGCPMLRRDRLAANLRMLFDPRNTPQREGSTMAAIGFIGLGNMGAPMAANLVKAGHRVTGFDVNANAVQALAATGVQAASSAAEASRGADVVITMLPAGEHVREVWLHQGGLIEAVKSTGPLLIDCSTIDVESAR